MDLFDLSKWPGFTNRETDACIDQLVIDSRQITSKNSLFVALPGKRHDGHSFVQDALDRGAKYILAKKSFAFNHPSVIHVDDPLRALQELAKLYRQEKKATVIAITGLYGKTLVKDFVCHILKEHLRVSCSPESFNSQIGVALSLFQIQSDHDIALIEAGISERGEMNHLIDMIQPTHAILTTVERAEDHIIEEKAKLLKAIIKDKWILLPNDPQLQAHVDSLAGLPLLWNIHDSTLPHAEKSISEPHNISFKIIYPSGAKRLFTWQHTFAEVLELINISIKAAWLIGMREDVITKALEEHVPEQMQTEIWRAPSGITFINDAYSADPISVTLALQKLELLSLKERRRVFIFNGLRESSLHTPSNLQKIALIINQSNLDRLILTGKDRQILEDAFKKTLQIPIFSYTTLNEAIVATYSLLQRDDTLLIQGPNKIQMQEIAKLCHDTRNNLLSIHLSSAEKNVGIFKNTRIMGIVKANAYGTDAVIFSKFLQNFGVSILGVAHPDEAIFLREHGVELPIFVIHSSLNELEKIVQWEFEVAISSLDCIERLELLALEQQKTIKVHLHIDTGMSRLGCRPSDALVLAKKINVSSSLILEGVMTHFACADMQEQDVFTQSQVACFRRCLQELKEHGIEPKYKHAANSSGALQAFFPEGNMIRIGLALYGLGSDLLEPALSLTSRIVGINHCQKGDTISYGRNYVIKEDFAKIAVIPLGYFDGLHRHFSGKGYVLIRGQKAFMAGNICMDFMMVDVSHIENVSVGDPVLIFGKDSHGNSLPLENAAANVGTNTHELITCLGPRIQRVFIEHDH